MVLDSSVLAVREFSEASGGIGTCAVGFGLTLLV